MTKDCKRSTTEKKKCEASHMEKSCNSKYSIAIPFNKKVNNFFYFLLFHCYFAVCCWFEFLPALKMFAGRSVVPVNLARGQHITHFMQHLMEFRNFYWWKFHQNQIDRMYRVEIKWFWCVLLNVILCCVSLLLSDYQFRGQSFVFHSTTGYAFMSVYIHERLQSMNYNFGWN